MLFSSCCLIGVLEASGREDKQTQKEGKEEEKKEWKLIPIPPTLMYRPAITGMSFPEFLLLVKGNSASPADNGVWGPSASQSGVCRTTRHG